MANTHVLPPHGCKSHSYQDDVYGRDKRLGNEIKAKQGAPTAARCTVCTKAVDVGKLGK